MKDRTYDYLYECPVCGGKHNIKSMDGTDNIIVEAETDCECGHKDYWAYGFYQSEQEPNK